DMPGDESSERARGYVAAEAARLRALGPAAAAGDDEAVHDARTASRRLRTALAVCRPLLAADGAVPTALRDLGRVLGAVRDPTVQLAWLRAALDSRPGDETQARARLEEDRLAARQAGLVAARRLLGSPEHARLLVGLDAVVAQPWPPDEGRIAHRAAREWHRLDRALAAADEAEADERDAARHAARRQARRARYATELVGGDAAEHSSALAAKLQDTLGAEHDAVVVRAVVAEVAARARAAGEDTAACAWLAALADDSAERAARAARRAAARANASGHRHWAA
ncbi:MAG TPA: CHAD domain-containing protein, partial [Cellulomonas sp.]